MASWLRQHDPGFLALRRAARTAIVMPTLFALGDKVIGNPVLATFAAFGSFALLTLVDFAGPMHERLQAEAALAVTGAALVCVGTLVSRSTGLAAVAMTLVAFGVIFAGAVSSVLAGATTSLLLSFILPVCLPGPVSSIPDRLAGWGMASGAALVAITLLWPAPARNPLRTAAIAACRALAARLRADVAFVRGELTGDERDAAVAAASAAVSSLHDVFFATPYRPTGLSTAARTVIRLVDEVRWLDDIIVLSVSRPGASSVDPRVCEVKLSAALVLERGADELDMPRRRPDELHEAQARLAEQRLELESSSAMRLPSGDGDPPERTGEVISALDPGFRAQELSFVVAQIGTNIDFAAAAERRGWLDRLLGRQPEGLAPTRAAARERAGSYARRQSVWLRNSVRGAVGLGLAVAVAKLTGVGHAFWVVLGALAVLRSNALNTGQSVVRGLLGTAVGFIVGAALVALVGTNTTLLWFLLPPAVLFAGLAPAAISFAAGQAAFTLTLLILFNILQPEGWRIGLVRIEDVALGCGVSLVVGLLFWPRGAASELGRALADAYVASATYLARAVDFGIECCDPSSGFPQAPTTDALGAAAAARRLDDTFRGYLAERGAKPIPMAEVTNLVTGVVGLRLAGDAVLDLWGTDPSPGDGDRSAARRELSAGAEEISDWYGGFAASLRDGAAVPDPLVHDEQADSRLVNAVSSDLRSADGQATATGVRMIWTGDHLDATRRLQISLVGPARAAAEALRSDI
ncbi:MAG TPA: FUSC family protein [Thermoleophilaceae bacterium]